MTHKSALLLVLSVLLRLGRLHSRSRAARETILPQHLGKGLHLVRGDLVRRKLRPWKLPLLHIPLVLLQRALNDLPHLGVSLAELGRHLFVVRVGHHAEQVVVHQDLQDDGSGSKLQEQV